MDKNRLSDITIGNHRVILWDKGFPRPNEYCLLVLAGDGEENTFIAYPDLMEASRARDAAVWAVFKWEEMQEKKKGAEAPSDDSKDTWKIIKISA